MSDLRWASSWASITGAVAVLVERECEGGCNDDGRRRREGADGSGSGDHSGDTGERGVMLND